MLGAMELTARLATAGTTRLTSVHLGGCYASLVCYGRKLRSYMFYNLGNRTQRTMGGR